MAKFQITRPLVGGTILPIISVDAISATKTGYPLKDCKCKVVHAVCDTDARAILRDAMRTGDEKARAYLTRMLTGRSRVYVCACVGHFVEDK